MDHHNEVQEVLQSWGFLSPRDLRQHASSPQDLLSANLQPSDNKSLNFMLRNLQIISNYYKKSSKYCIRNNQNLYFANTYAYMNKWD